VDVRDKIAVEVQPLPGEVGVEIVHESGLVLNRLDLRARPNRMEVLAPHDRGRWRTRHDLRRHSRLAPGACQGGEERHLLAHIGGRSGRAAPGTPGWQPSPSGFSPAGRPGYWDGRAPRPGMRLSATSTDWPTPLRRGNAEDTTRWRSPPAAHPAAWEMWPGAP